MGGGRLSEWEVIDLASGGGGLSEWEVVDLSNMRL